MGRAMFSISFIILLFSSCGHSRLVTEVSGDLVSDGIRFLPRTPYLDLEQPTSIAACDLTYGFVPCSSTVLGNIFLVVVYGYFMYIAANYISIGCEHLLEVLGPGLVGGLFLPVLGALPDAILVLVSGLSGSKEAAQHQVMIGMGLLAGSTVVLLTLLWGTCIIVGQSGPSTSTEPPSSLTGCGVITDDWTSHAAKIMVGSVLPFIIIQLPNVFNMPNKSRIAILISLIASVIFLLSYCLYQVFQPLIQKRRLAYVKRTHVISGILRHFQEGLGKLLTEDGQPNIPVLRRMFHGIDTDQNGHLSDSELRELIIGIQLTKINSDTDHAVKKIMDELDESGDGRLSEEEFLKGVSNWLNEAKRAVPNSRSYSQHLHDFHQITKEKHDKMVDVKSVDNPGWIYFKAGNNPGWICFKAVLRLLLGTVIAAAFAEPLVNAVDDFSTATSIPSFFTAFLVLPLVSNTSEAVSAITFASQKTKRSSSLTFSEIYGAVTMKNTLCLAVFLALVYVRDLTWMFSAEVLISLIVCVVVGLFTSFRTRFPLWTSVAAYALYPSSLALVYVLDYVAGW